MASKRKAKTKAEAKPKAKAKQPEAKAKPKAKPPTKALRPDGLREGSDGAKLVDAVCRKAGATHAELCEVVSWKSLPSLHAEVGSTGQGEAAQGKAGREVRYFGTASA